MQPRHLNYLLIFFLCLVSFAVYFNSLHGEFLIDDTSAILNNPQIHSVRVCLKSFRLKPGALGDLIHAFLWKLGAGKSFPFHLFNVSAHVICTVLLFILYNLLFKNAILSFLASLIFAAHPIHTEVVSWISGGPYGFSSIFFLTALIFYTRSDKAIINLVLAVFFFACGLLTGSPIAMLPAIFLTYDLFFRESFPEDKIFLVKLRHFVLSAIFFITLAFIGSFFFGRNNYMHTIYYFKGPSYLIVVVKALVYYLKILYLPLQRGLYHPFAYNTIDTNKITPAFFGSLTVILISFYLFFKCRKNHKPISFAIAWFFLTYLPYSNLIPVCNIISERYMYLPSAGFCLFLAYVFLQAWKIINKDGVRRRALRVLAMLAAVIFILSYVVLTVKRNREYKDIIIYWETNINNFPDGYMAYNNLAGTFYVMGEKEQAKAYCWVTLMINPKQPHVWCNLAKVYREERDLKMAKYCYEEALKADPAFLPALRALAELRKSLKEKPRKLK